MKKGQSFQNKKGEKPKVLMQLLDVHQEILDLFESHLQTNTRYPSTAHLEVKKNLEQLQGKYNSRMENLEKEIVNAEKNKRKSQQDYEQKIQNLKNLVAQKDLQIEKYKKMKRSKRQGAGSRNQSFSYHWVYLLIVLVLVLLGAFGYVYHSWMETKQELFQKDHIITHINQTHNLQVTKKEQDIAYQKKIHQHQVVLNDLTRKKQSLQLVQKLLISSNQKYVEIQQKINEAETYRKQLYQVKALNKDLDHLNRNCEKQLNEKDKNFEKQFKNIKEKHDKQLIDLKSTNERKMNELQKICKQKSDSFNIWKTIVIVIFIGAIILAICKCCSSY